MKTNIPKLRFIEFKDAPEWKEKKLGDVVNIHMCKRIFNNQTTEVGDIPFYKISTFGKTADSYISNKLFQNYKARYKYPKKMKFSCLVVVL